MMLRLDPSLTLEILNGVGVILAGCFLVFLTVYLAREHKARNLRLRDWFFRLPPSMHLVVAIYVFDLGVVVRAGVIWIWRRFFEGGSMSLMQLMLLLVGAVIIAIGSLCKIRAVSKPSFGNWPWLASLALVVAYLVVESPRLF
jgi:hypothetical protein